MNPIRGDVKKKFSPILSERRRVVACIQPNLSSGEAVGSLRIPHKREPSKLPNRYGQVIICSICGHIRSSVRNGRSRRRKQTIANLCPENDHRSSSYPICLFSNER